MTINRIDYITTFHDYIHTKYNKVCGILRLGQKLAIKSPLNHRSIHSCTLTYVDVLVVDVTTNNIPHLYNRIWVIRVLLMGRILITEFYAVNDAF